MKSIGTLPKRFATKCSPRLPSGCIEWLAYRMPNGYGTIREAGKNSRHLLAHRAAWQLAKGEIPAGMNVLHRCDNPSCVNVDHLFLGTQADNVSDMISKGRQPWKERTPWQKLDEADAIRIAELRADGYTQQKIADLFKVSRPLISLLLARKFRYFPRSSDHC